jgi:hypothetical protein
LKLLEEAIGIELELEAQKKDVGLFKANIEKFDQVFRKRIRNLCRLEVAYFKTLIFFKRIFVITNITFA